MKTILKKTDTKTGKRVKEALRLLKAFPEPYYDSVLDLVVVFRVGHSFLGHAYYFVDARY